MRSWIYDRYGPPEVLELREVPDPPPPTGAEVVVRVHALAMNPKDVLVRKGRFSFLPGVRPPLVPCHDLAGVVVAAGPRADLAIGAEVYGWRESFTGGAGAELVTLDARLLAPKPPSLSMEEAAAVPLAALTALMALRDDLRVRPGEHVLIHGASGGVGVFAVQIARLLGARVTATSSAGNRELVLDLGAHAHLDHREVDPASARGVDAFFDVFGNRPYAVARATLTPGGRYCTTLPRPGTALRGALARLGLRRDHLVVVRSRRADLEVLTGWIEAGALRPVIDRVLPWTELPAAHAAIETKRTRGKIVLTVAGR